MPNPLFDKNFLKELDVQPNKEKYVKIIALDINDKPLEIIEGKVTSGNINVDGNSAVRRTCSLTLNTPLKDTIITDPYWSFNTKIDVKIGVRNFIDDKYPDIVWFDMGIFLLSSFSISKSTNALNISLQGKDKMCRLNGEMGGVMMSEWDWGAEEYYDHETDTRTINKIPIRTIIYNIVREMAQERPENIIIRDLDTYGYELWEYAGSEPMYYLKERGNGNIKLVTFKQNTAITAKLGGSYVTTTVSKLEQERQNVTNGKYYSTNTLDPEYNNDATEVVSGKNKGSGNFVNGKIYNVVKIDYGETAGYHQIPLVFNTDLIAKAGETAMSVLDKIKKMLGNFEYFYNTQGQFIFQKKNDYVQELYATSSGALTTPMMMNEMYSYRFEDESYFTQISESPQIGNIKNDFVVWGTTSVGKAPLHARCALDKKPVKYTSPWSRIYRVGGLVEAPMRTGNEKYWYKNTDGSYGQNLTSNKKDENKKVIDTIYYHTGILNNKAAGPFHLFTHASKLKRQSTDTSLSWKIEKGMFHGDTKSILVSTFWATDKEGKNPIDNTSSETNWTVEKSLELLKLYDKNLYVELPAGRTYTYNITSGYDWRELIYQMAIDYRKHGMEPDYYIELEAANPEFVYNGRTGYESYYIDLEGFWRQLYDPTPYNGETVYTSGSKRYWNTKIHTDPNSLLFWFEFFDTQGDLGKYSVHKIGQRPKVVNENTVTSIYHKETPEVQFYVSGEEWEDEADKAYIPVQITTDDELLFYRSAQGQSAIGRINELMINHLNLAEGINLTTIPIYYLQPNTRVQVAGKGDYTINKITYNFSYNGTMSLNGSKIYKQWY